MAGMPSAAGACRVGGVASATGDATGTGAGGSTIWNGNSYPNEISDRLHHYAGAVAMAHAPDGASGNLSQFYIVQSAQDSVDKTLAKTLTEAGVREAVVTAYQAVGGAPYLDNLNTVFGQVYDGMDVVDAIAAVECGEDDRPLEDVIVNSVTIGTYSAAQSGSTPASGASGSVAPGVTPPKYLAVMARARLARLPRSLARSALNRPAKASSEKLASAPKTISRSMK